MMQIIVNIDDETYDDIKKGKIYSSFRDVPLESVNAIANGVPLPKGHGDIVDIETLINMFWDGNSMEITKYDLSVIEPIINADKEDDV